MLPASENFDCVLYPPVYYAMSQLKTHRHRLQQQTKEKLAKAGLKPALPLAAQLPADEDAPKDANCRTSLIDVFAEAATAIWMAEFTQSLCLDLADTLSGYTK